MTQYNILASSDESTVVTEYIPDSDSSSAYQSEAALEKEFIALLEDKLVQFRKICGIVSYRVLHEKNRPDADSKYIIISIYNKYSAIIFKYIIFSINIFVHIRMFI